LDFSLKVFFSFNKYLKVVGYLNDPFVAGTSAGDHQSLSVSKTQF